MACPTVCEKNFWFGEKFFRKKALENPSTTKNKRPTFPDNFRNFRTISGNVNFRQFRVGIKPGVGFPLHKKTISDISGIVGGIFSPTKKKARHVADIVFCPQRKKTRERIRPFHRGQIMAAARVHVMPYMYACRHSVHVQVSLCTACHWHCSMDARMV